MFEKEAERKILEALAKGELDNLKGHGKPLPEDPWENPLIPEDIKQSYRILKNASILPEEVKLKVQLEELKQKLENEELSPEEREKLIKEISKKDTEFNVKLEAFRSLSLRK